MECNLDIYPVQGIVSKISIADICTIKTPHMKYIITAALIFCTSILQAKDYKLEGSEVKIEKQVLFETGTAILKPESTAALEIIKKYLEDKSYISLLRVECHTDNSGDNDVNQTLSEKRALAVC